MSLSRKTVRGRNPASLINLAAGNIAMPPPLEKLFGVFRCHGHFLDVA